MKRRSLEPGGTNKSMHLRTLLKEILTEVSVQQLKTQFVDSGKISEEDFREVLKVSKGKSAYATWLAKHLESKHIKSEDLYKYEEYLTTFSKHSSEFPQKDIFQYKTPADITAFISAAEDIIDKVEENPALAKGISKSDKFASLKIGEVNGFDVYELPKGRVDLYDTSCELGSGTKWCTATGNTKSHFLNYIKEGPLYIFINPKTKEKYQFHYESNQFKDTRDLDIF